MMVMFELLRLVFCAPFLLYGCYTDWKTRRVPNKVWLYMLPGAIVFFLIDVYSDFPAHLVWTLVYTGIIFSVAYLFFKLRLIGGADAKALMMLAIVFPLYPQFTLAGYVFPLFGLPVIPSFTITVFYNSIILNSVIFPSLFLWNLSHLGVKEFLRHPHYFFLGYKTDVSRLSHKHARLLENYVEENGEIKPVFSIRGVRINDDVKKNLLELVKNGEISDEVWVMPGIPFFIPLTLGFFTAVLFGDLLFWFVLHFVS
jgi:preflagellin peptidase FlaK